MNRILPVLLGVLLGTLGGGALMWFVVDEPPRPDAGHSAGAHEDEDDTDIDDTESDPEKDEDELPSMDKELDNLVRENQQLEREARQLKDDKRGLETEVERLNARVTELESDEDAIVEIPVPGNGGLPVAFGKWREVDELNEADWKELGATIQTMHGMMEEIRKSLDAGEDTDPALQQKLGEENRKLANHYFKVMGKLPTHFDLNGEFTHPVNLVNFLAGQLESAGDPLSERQLDDLADLGDRYEERWTELQEGYDEDAWALEKRLDEAELKEWFKEEMFRVTTAQQKATALPPSVEDVVGLDLYSSGLNLRDGLEIVRGADVDEVKAGIKTHIENSLSIERTTIDSAEYIFDDWTYALADQLQPVAETGSDIIYARDIIAAGKAQLSGLTQFASAYVSDTEKKAGFRALTTVLLPQIVMDE